MKGKTVNPPYRPYSQDNPFIVIFRRRIQFFFRCYHARCVNIFVEDKKAFKTVWAVHLSKICVTGLAISDPPETESHLQTRDYLGNEAYMAD